jgi:hypothetical protein
MIRAVAGIILVLALASCASVSVEEGTQRVTQKMPEIVYVLDFSTEGSDFKGDRTGKDLADFKKNLQKMLNAAMVADLTDRLVIAAPARKSDWSLKKSAWIVRGEFTKVYQGSRFLRGAIGFGAGGTKVETRVQVYDLASDSATPFLTFSTTGGSNSEPGAILALTTDPVQLAIGGVTGVAHGLSEDTARTAREITAELSDYMHSRGWISDDRWIKPKRQRATETW